MPQFDFYAFCNFTIFFAAFAAFTTFVIVLYVALDVWLNAQVRLLFKAQLVRETSELLRLANLSFLGADLLEQFILPSGLSCLAALSACAAGSAIIIVVGGLALSRAVAFVGSVGVDVYAGGAFRFSRAWYNLSALFVGVLLANLLGILPFSFTLTSSLAAPFLFSLTMFYVCAATAAARSGLRSFAGFLPAGTERAIAPLVIIIELVSNTAKFISLGVRLFANMFAGHLLLKVFYSICFQVLAAVNFFIFFVEAAMLFFVVFIIFLEIMIAFLQAFVFVLLSILYLKEAESFISSH